MAQLPIKMISAVFLVVLLFAVESVSAADFSRLKNQVYGYKLGLLMDVSTPFIQNKTVRRWFVGEWRHEF